MKIALCQFQIEYEEKEKNLIRAERYISEAAMQQAELILFPEMSFTGFSMNTEKTGDEHLETLKNMQSLAKKYRIAIGFGFVEYKVNSENHYAVVDEEGKILGDYIKLHPFSFAGEEQHFVKGQAISFFNYRGIKFGMTICYDLRFPELYQRLSQEADAIIVAANWPKERIHQWDVLLEARAIENQSYLLGINCTGSQGQTTYCGHGKIVAPDGKVELFMDEYAGVKYYEMEDNVKEYREAFPMKQDRRKELYKNFY